MTNNQLNVDAFMKKFAARFPEDSKDEKRFANMREILKECKGQTGEVENDRCESSANVLQCINDGSRKHGMKKLF